MRVALPPAGEVDQTTGLGPIAAFGENFGAGVMDISINAKLEKTGNLITSGVRNLIESILKSDDDNIQKFHVKAREHENDPLELIDLLQHREKRTRMLEVNPETRNIAVEERWSALREIHSEYCNNVS